jgi:aspartate aminotransferase
LLIVHLCTASVKRQRFSLFAKTLTRLNPINLSLGELQRPTPQSIVDAGIEALNQGFTHYSPVEGIYDLRLAIANQYAQKQFDVGPENVMITPGVRQAVHNILQNIIEPGDEVILPSPYWFAFPDLIKLSGGVVVPLETTLEDQYSIDPDKLRSLITPKTRLFIFNNPCNPSGRVYTKEEIRNLVAVLEPHPEISILSDETYQYIVYDKTFYPFSREQAIIDRMITVSGFSKTFAMAGWRVGYIVASEKLIQQFRRFQEVSLSGISLFTQYAALKAMEIKVEYLKELMASLEERRQTGIKYLNQVDGLRYLEPHGSYYFFPDVSYFFGTQTPDGQTIESAAQVVSSLFRLARIQVRPGLNFGAANHIRIGFTVDNGAWEEGIARVTETLSSFRR